MHIAQWTESNLYQVLMQVYLGNISVLGLHIQFVPGTTSSWQLKLSLWEAEFQG